MLRIHFITRILKTNFGLLEDSGRLDRRLGSRIKSPNFIAVSCFSCVSKGLVIRGHKGRSIAHGKTQEILDHKLSVIGAFPSAFGS